jgi:hypothetical protein
LIFFSSNSIVLILKSIPAIPNHHTHRTGKQSGGEGMDNVNAMHPRHKQHAKGAGGGERERDERTNGGDERGVERIVRESEKNACLANSRVTNEQKLEEVIVCLGPHGVCWYRVMRSCSRAQPKEKVVVVVVVVVVGGGSEVSQCLFGFVSRKIDCCQTTPQLTDATL